MSLRTAPMQRQSIGGSHEGLTLINDPGRQSNTARGARSGVEAMRNPARIEKVIARSQMPIGLTSNSQDEITIEHIAGLVAEVRMPGDLRAWGQFRRAQDDLPAGNPRFVVSLEDCPRHLWLGLFRDSLHEERPDRCNQDSEHREEFMAAHHCQSPELAVGRLVFNPRRLRSWVTLLTATAGASFPQLLRMKVETSAIS